MVQKATNDDSRVLAEMAVQMWDSHTVDELESGFIDALNNDGAVLFIKYLDSKPVGFAQCGLRTDYVEGTNTSPVGYLEGYAKELLDACEKWAKDKGCTEFASDCELNNSGSLQFHMAMGFEEANRIICFRKEI